MSKDKSFLISLYRQRLSEITSAPTYFGANSNLVADVYERRLHKINQPQNQKTEKSL